MLAGHGEMVGWSGLRQGHYRRCGTGHLGRKTQNGDRYRKYHRHSLALTHHRHKKGGGRSLSSPFTGCFTWISVVGIITQSGVTDTVTSHELNGFY